MTSLDGVERTFDVVLCTNLLEHVSDRTATLHHVKRVVAPRGLLLLTVPRRYRLHQDPIDTGFRPTPEALDELVGWGDVLARELVTVRAKRHYAGARRMRRWFLPWQIACLLVRKPAE